MANIIDDTKKKVLVVDDERINVKMVLTVLQQLGFNAVSASSGEEAVALIDESFFAIVTDLNMFELTGNDVARYAKKKNERIRVILCYSTGIAVPEDNLYYRILKKPFLVADLVDALL